MINFIIYTSLTINNIPLRSTNQKFNNFKKSHNRMLFIKINIHQLPLRIKTFKKLSKYLKYCIKTTLEFSVSDRVDF